MMVSSIIGIALFTSVYGRLFCGWACPQTVFMEMVFRKLEWWIEGSPNEQRKLNAGPWTREKWIKKTSKHVLFFLLSFLIAITFLSYILGVETVWNDLKHPLEHISLFLGLLIFTGLFYGVFAFVREIVCTTICPYGRLQGVLIDKNSMQVSYDFVRGEPRGKINKKETTRSLGSCIDCKQCIAVCPTGIDIRNGSQMECVGCTACIDACDSIMEKVNFPKGLIRYASENNITEKTGFQWTFKVKAYTSVLIALVLLTAVMIYRIKTIDVYVSRVKGQTYQELPNDTLANFYRVKLINKSLKPETITLRLEDVEGRVVFVKQQAILLPPQTITEEQFFVHIPNSTLKTRTTDIHLGVYNKEALLYSIKTNFLGTFQ